MKKIDIAREIATKVDGITVAQAEECVDNIFEIIAQCLEDGGSYNHKNFGTFKRVERAARKGRNPQTKEMVIIPETKALKIVVSESLKTRLNK